MVTLKQIEAVHWVEKLGSFHAAAERLNTTQSTISKRIQELEHSLGFQIFDRSNKTSQVTLKGRGLLGDFAAMISLHQKIEDSTKEDSSFAGQFHLGATEMVALTWLPKLIGAVTSRFPNLKLRTSISLAHELQDKLLGYKFDLILSPHSFAETPAGLSALPLVPLESAWMCGSAIAAGQHGMLTVKDIAGMPLLTYAEGSLLHQTVVKMLAEHGFTARQTITCSSMIAIAELVRGGLGIAYLPREYFLAYGGLSLLHTEIPTRPLKYAAIYRDEFIASQIAQLAQETCNFGRPSP